MRSRYGRRAFRASPIRCVGERIKATGVPEFREVAWRACDPGLRVFCNIAIEDDWPWQDDDVVSTKEDQAISRFSKLLLTNLKHRLPTSELNSVALLLNISQRSATISIETGWIELVFNMQDVDTNIRLAGLDLDPDYVPWLGKVVKFRYA